MSPLRGCPCFLRRRLVGATLVVALPPNGATVRRPLLGHYRTGGGGAACFTRRLGPASFRAPGMATWSGDSAGERCDPAGHPQGVPLRSSGIGPTGRLETALPMGDWKSPLRASGMIPREIGRGLSISGTHRVTAVERLVGATLVVALPRTEPLSAGHCLGTTEPGGWSGDFPVADWDRRPERRVSRAGWDRRPSGRREWRRGAETQPGNDATPQGTRKGCPYGHRGLEVSKRGAGGFKVSSGASLRFRPLSLDSHEESWWPVRSSDFFASSWVSRCSSFFPHWGRLTSTCSPSCNVRFTLSIGSVFLWPQPSWPPQLLKLNRCGPGRISNNNDYETSKT